MRGVFVGMHASELAARQAGERSEWAAVRITTGVPPRRCAATAVSLSSTRSCGVGTCNPRAARASMARPSRPWPARPVMAPAIIGGMSCSAARSSPASRQVREAAGGPTPRHHARPCWRRRCEGEVPRGLGAAPCGQARGREHFLVRNEHEGTGGKLGGAADATKASIAWLAELGRPDVPRPSRPLDGAEKWVPPGISTAND